MQHSEALKFMNDLILITAILKRQERERLAHMFFNRMKLLCALVLIVMLAACSTNPATGSRQFTAFMPQSSEARIGAQEHQKIVSEYGVSQNAKLNEVVQRVGRSLAPHTELDNVNYTFTVLDTPDVNAFALPGGFVYVTRGLLALANNEAELASVMAHEIGHVTARHSAERYSRGAVASIGAGLIGILLESEDAAKIAGSGASLYLASYSRDQEHEADSLGIRYASRAGYDPYAMSSFLTSLERQSELRAQELGKPARQAPSYMATHPITRERVSRTLTQASQNPMAGNENAKIRTEPYLQSIHNMVYGDTADQGFVHEKSGLFVHPKMGFSFELSSAIHLVNNPKELIFIGNGGDAVGFAEIKGKRAEMDLLDHVVNGWLKGKKLASVRETQMNGFKVVEAQMRKTIEGKPGTLYYYGFEWAPTMVMQFNFALPDAASPSLKAEMRNIALSFSRMSAAQSARYKPKRVIVFEASGGSSVAQIAQRMPFRDGFNEMRFRVLNGLSSSDQLQRGALYKTIVQ
jgi:predicted Zn-dependent protease